MKMSFLLNRSLFRSVLYNVVHIFVDLQAIAKRVGTQFAMTFNQASLNIERGEGGLEGYYIVPWPFIVRYLQEIGKMLSVSSILQLLVDQKMIRPFVTVVGFTETFASNVVRKECNAVYSIRCK